MDIAVVQLDMAWEDKSLNRSRVKGLLEEQPPNPGSLVMLPEMFETGFSMNVDKTAQPADRPAEIFLRELASQHDVAVMAGVVSPSEDGRARNEAVVFAPDGNELCRYQKMQPFSMSGEGDCYPAGDGFQLFEWQGVKVAPFICYDLRFPEIFRPAVQAGAELLTLIACWPARRSEHWVRLLQARAIENLACVVGTNRVGTEPNLVFDGRSSAFDHMGRCLFEADDQMQVLKTTLDIDELREWRAHFPALRDARS